MKKQLLTITPILVLATSLLSGSDGWRNSAPGTASDEKAMVVWWQNFGDPKLNHLIQLAVDQNYDIAIAQTRIREARSQVTGSRSKQLPSLDLSGAYANVRLSENGIGSDSAAARAGITRVEDDFFQLGFDASWEIDLFGGVRGKVKASQSRLLESEEQRRAILLSVIAEVVRNYVELRGTQQRLAVLEDNIQIESKTLRLVTGKVKAGLVNPIDTARATVLLESSRAKRSPLKAQLHLLFYRISVLIGEEPHTLQERLAEVKPIPAPQNRVTLGVPSDLVIRRPDLRASAQRILASRADVKTVRADLYPRLTLNGSLGLEAGLLGDLFKTASKSWLLLPGLHLPIFNRGRLKARVRAAEAVQDRERLQFELTLLRALEEVEAALVRYAEHQLEYEHVEKASKSAAEAVRLSHILYESGLSDYLSVLDAERSKNDVDDHLVVVETASMTELTALYKALGGGWQAF